MMVAVVEGQRFQKPTDVDAQRHGLTEGVWAAIECCCAYNPVNRPPVANLNRLPFLRNLVDNRPND